jgi:hypothetical protein
MGGPGMPSPPARIPETRPVPQTAHRGRRGWSVMGGVQATGSHEAVGACDHRSTLATTKLPRPTPTRNQAAGTDTNAPRPGGTPQMRRATRLRLVRVFRRGWNLILVALLDQTPLPMGRFIPDPWPAVMALEEQAPLLPNWEVPLAACGLRRQEQQEHA